MLFRFDFQFFFVVLNGVFEVKVMASRACLCREGPSSVFKAQVRYV